MNFFAELPIQAKAIIGGLAVLLLVAIGVNFIPRGGGGPDKGADGQPVLPAGQVIIYQNLEPQAAAEAAAELKDKAVPFTIVRDGTAIQVPADKADEARIKLALKSLPKEGTIGFSQLFGDKPAGFISTDFEKKVAYNRALNGELSRLVRKIEGIDAAAVLVNTPEEQLFTEAKKPVTASVMVKLAPGRALAPNQVQGIQHLIASAVPGLKTTNVTVVSDAGRLLSDGMAENAGDTTDQLVERELKRQLALTKERETAIENKVQAILDKMYGNGKAVVKVALELDFTQTRRRTELLAPPTDRQGNPVPTEQSLSSERSAAGAGATGGIPGVTGNVPDPPIYPFGGAAGASAQGAERMSSRTATAMLSREQTLTNEAVGTIKRMSVTALVQGLTPSGVPTLTQIVAATAGADVARRGDQVVVQPVAFDTSQTDQLKALLDQQDKAAKPAPEKTTKKKAFPWLVGIGAAFVALVLLVALIRMTSRKPETTDVLVNALGTPAGFDPNALSGQFANPQYGAPQYGAPQYGANPYEMTGQVPQANGYDAGAYGEPGPFAFLEQMAPEMVAEVLMQERPATAAGILSAVEPGFGDMVLSMLPPETQEDIIGRLQNQQPMPAFQQKTIAAQLKRRLGVPA